MNSTAVRTIFACVIALTLPRCNDAGDIYSLAEWRDTLKGNGNWHFVKVPDSKLVPGSIVKITKEDGLSWIDSLQSCGIPAALLAGLDAGNPDALVIRGASPKIEFKKSKEYSADAVLKIAGIKAGPEFNTLGKVAHGPLARLWPKICRFTERARCGTWDLSPRSRERFRA